MRQRCTVCGEIRSGPHFRTVAGESVPCNGGELAPERVDRQSMFMAMAYALAERSSCLRGQVGALIVIDNRPAGGGYNGAPSGVIDCIQVGSCEMLGGAELGCQRAIHAEANAIAWAARHGVRTEGATMYSTHSPCKACAQLIAAAKFDHFVYAKNYRAERLDILQTVGIMVTKFEGDLVVEYR